ncbi:MAG: aminoacyl-histidine dipeptidase [Bacteroidales bacterium]|nr:aminoacyl-histidine dipeptidase [Bacteroidales bacterium]
MRILDQLEPKEIWQIFEDICQVPRPSKKEHQIIDFLLNWAEANNITAKRDKAGNVLMSKPATPGKEHVRPVVMQSHMDMVCEKNSDVEFNFETDAIVPRINGEWVKATGTTLGADDGIGMAAQMAVLLSTDITHGPIEALFTVDEETGLTGAFELEPNFFTAKTLINLDSEDEGELFIGCAGGIDTMATFDFEEEAVPENHSAFKIEVKGLNGGHSGDDINKGYGNANKILTRILWNSDQFELRIADMQGGNLRNAIAREAWAIVTVHNNSKDEFKALFEQYSSDVKNELKATEKNLSLTLSEVDMPAWVIDEETHYNLVNALYACPHGVIAMSRDMDNMVETSTNLASVKIYKKDHEIKVATSQRSSVESSKHDIASMVESVFLLADAKVEHGDGYPGWAPNTNSEIMKHTAKSYEKLFGIKPIVRSIHAGLECGLFLEKYPDLDMISFGPTLRAVHSPDERIEIKSVEKFWKHLKDVLETIQ